jgi:hypothetical protein
MTKTKTKTNTVNTLSKATAQEKATFKWQLQEIEKQIANSPAFYDKEGFNSDLAIATGFSGTLSMSGFQAIVDYVADDVGQVRNEFNHVDHNAIVKSEFGPLLRTIVYLLCFSYGTKRAHDLLIAESSGDFRAEFYDLAQMFSQRLVLNKEQSQRLQPKESILQMVVRKQMSTKQLFCAIKLTLKGFTTDYFNQVNRGTQQNLLKRVNLFDDSQNDESDHQSSHICISEDIWDDFESHEGSVYAQDLFLSAIDQLSADQKHLLNVLFKLDPAIYEKRKSFRTQIGCIYKFTGFTKRYALRMADEIVVSIRDFLGITVFERSVTALVPVHCSKSVLAKRTTHKPASFKMKEVEVREDYFVSELLEPQHIDNLFSEINRSVDTTIEAILAKLN